MQYILAFALGYFLVCLLSPPPAKCLMRSEPYRVEVQKTVRAGDPLNGVPEVTRQETNVVTDCVQWDK